MGFADKYNRGTVNFDIDIKDFEFKSLADVGDDILKIDGFYINTKGRYGDHPVVIVGDKQLLVDVPKHLTDVYKDMIKDAAFISAVKEGKVGIQRREYQQGKNTYYTCDIVDL